MQLLVDENAAHGFPVTWQMVCFTLRDSAGVVQGGFIGETHWGWLHVNVLAVASRHRGRGWGSRLLARGEDWARGNSCHHAYLTTTSFQARPFYEQRGYRVAGELPNFPLGETLYLMAKELDWWGSARPDDISEAPDDRNRSRGI
ncbi:MAG TPA: GNAT family N-acetyltransferase [Gemmatimonadaceae bacterium]|nr:GNAT family N-acetyltransferase [Gemmatimonadaceae bacterium]